MFDNIQDVYPDVEFWVLSNKGIKHEVVLTYEQLLARFGEDQLARVINNFDPHWIAWKQ